MGVSRILALREPLAPLRKQTALWALTLSLSAAALYAGFFIAAGYAEQLWVRILAGLGLGPAIALLFRIAHDAGHGSHFAQPRLDRWVCRLSLLPSYHPHSVWLLLHNGRHHSFTNLRDNDYIWIPLSPQEYQRLGFLGRLKERAYRTTLGVGLYYLCAIWAGMVLQRRTLVRKRKPIYARDTAVIVAFFLLQVVLLALDRPEPSTLAERLVLAIVLPFIIFNWLVGFASFLNHTHPSVPWFADRAQWSFYRGQVHCTVHVGVPKWMIFFLTDLGLHGAHHIDPRIPIWQLESAEERIAAAAGEEIVFEPWTWARHREIMRSCQLYDYAKHQWVHFDGQPATPPIPVRQVSP